MPQQLPPALRDALLNLQKGTIHSHPLTRRALIRRGWMSADQQITAEGLRVIQSGFNGYSIAGEGGAAASDPRYLEAMETFLAWCKARGSSFSYEMIQAVQARMRTAGPEIDLPPTRTM